jgi:dTDP-4-dehydrorhamnose reductase
LRRRILITGAAGQLGHDLIATLGEEEVYAFDLPELDITNQRAVSETINRLRPEWIINAAAYNDVDRAEEDESLAFAVNSAGPGHLAEAASRVGCSIVHISSDFVFDGRKGSPYVETDRPNPLNVYGQSKLEGEHRVLESGAAASVLRTAWLYGKQGPRSFVKAILAAAENGQPLRVVADQVGSPTSSADLTTAILQLMSRPKPGLFHVTNGGSCSRFEFAQAIVRRRVPVEPISTSDSGRRAVRPANSSLTSERWEAAGFTALRPWQDALDDYLVS